MSRVALFIPCYIDQFYPRVGLAALRLLRQLGVDVEFPPAQTCCGQPMANSGCAEQTRPIAERFLRIFAPYDHVVSPSGSCVSMVRNHYAQWLEGHPGFDHLRANTFELCEYLVDIAGVTKVDGDFPLKVGLHMSCHGLRELRLASSSERMVPPFNKVRQLLAQLKGIELIELTRPDECCGFGGTFAVDEEAVSSLMGRDRIADHLHGGAEVITGFDVSCLMHLEGIIRRQALAAGAASVAAYPAAKPAPAAGAPSFGAYPAAKPEKTPLRVMHVAEILEAARLS